MGPEGEAFVCPERENSMSNFRALISISAAGLLAVILPQARADEWNQMTTLTFSGPVEIPGRVLSPGTYVFKLADSQSDRNIVQVFNKDENHLYGTFLAIPDYRLRPASKPIITFEERAAGAPPAVRAWFYPGDNYGHEFVYPKAKAAELAKVNHTPVASMPNELAANTTKAPQNTNSPEVLALKKAPLTAQQPTQEEVQITQAFPPQPPQTQAEAQVPKTLPKTASPMALFGLLGFLSLGSGALLRLTGGRPHSTNR
jgi:hypothetical protein